MYNEDGLTSEPSTMLHKAIVATSILLLMMGAVSAQMPQPGVHLKDDKPSRTKEQKEYDKELDRAYQSTIKKIPEQKKSDPWGDIRPASPTAAAKNKQQ
jgi:uncharacterized protein YecT (DUF1311 family)